MSQTYRIDRPCLHDVYAYWKSKSSKLFPLQMCRPSQTPHLTVSSAQIRQHKNEHWIQNLLWCESQSHGISKHDIFPRWLFQARSLGCDVPLSRPQTADCKIQHHQFENPKPQNSVQAQLFMKNTVQWYLAWKKPQFKQFKRWPSHSPLNVSISCLLWVPLGFTWSSSIITRTHMHHTQPWSHFPRHQQKKHK